MGQPVPGANQYAQVQTTGAQQPAPQTYQPPQAYQAPGAYQAGSQQNYQQPYQPAPYQQPYQAPQYRAPDTGTIPKIPSYMGWAIVTLILCFWPTGIAAVAHASQVGNRLAVGDVAGAKESSRKAKIWCWITFGIASSGSSPSSSPSRPSGSPPPASTTETQARDGPTGASGAILAGAADPGPDIRRCARRRAGRRRRDAEGWRSLVDRTGLENRQAARSQGFESPPLRLICRAGLQTVYRYT